MQTLIDRHCYHCHMPLLRAPEEGQVWCERCRHSPGAVCSFCKGDIADARACWNVERMLDLALVGGTIGQTAACGHCGTALSVSSLTGTRAVLICPRCGRMLTLTWTWARKSKRGSPPVDPDGPLPTY